MAPGDHQGRKRKNRGSMDDVVQRPSPHRPGNSNLGRDERQGGGGGQRRSTGGGRNNGPRRSDQRNERRNSYSQDVNSIPITARTPTTPGPMSPPPPLPVSRAQTPTPSTTPVAEASPEALKMPRPQFNYEYVTEQRVSTWKAKGRRDVVEQGISAREDEDLMELSMLFQELIQATHDGIMEPAEAGDVVKDILGDDAESSPAFDSASIFLDCLSIATEGIAEDSRSNQLLHTFITSTGVSPSLMRQKLDGKLLQNVGLTRNTFGKVGIRKVTNLLYRQANYNLLREETEGYSKLMTELFTTSTQQATDEVISDLFERVKGLIGTFDLDVGRVLDVTLDVFAALLIRFNRFFVKFLRASSWWPRNQIPGDLGSLNYGILSLPRWALPGSEVADAMKEDEEMLKSRKDIRDIAFWDRAREVGLDAYFELGGRRFDASVEAVDGSVDSDWIRLTGTVPPSGNRTAAQLLGFKLRFYASTSRDVEDKLPLNLIFLAALLIKIGFISLRDLYPHLWPLDEVMEEVKEKRMKQLEEKERLNRPGGSATNALMMAGALADDTPSRSRETEKGTTTKVEPASSIPDPEADKLLLDPTDWQSNQKVALLISLLTIGALPESLFILGKFPWLMDAFPEDLLHLIHRILHHSIDKLHSASQPIAMDVPTFAHKKFAETDPGTTSTTKIVRQVDAIEKKVLRWPYPDKSDTLEGKNYVFYWSEWANNIPVCQEIDDLFTLCSTFLNYSGVNIGKDVALLHKIARIGNHSLASDSSDHNLARWKDLLKRTLVPALSLTKANSAVVNEVYDMLRRYSVSERFTIYAEWYEGQISRLPAIKTAFASAKLETEATMKRISKTNVTDMARKLARIAYSSPGIVFKVALNQIEAYSNLIEVVVECGRYFTDLGYDVLVWSLMSSLGGMNRSRVQENGMATSRWLQALALFSGKVFKRYSIMNVTPILQYVNNQLCNGNPTDLIVLEEIATQMAGIVSDTDFNNAQLEAMTGGDALRRQTLINLQDKRHESIKTAKRLIRALVDSNLAPQLLISIAQTRQKSAYDIPDEDAHTKLIATLTDETQRILVQFLELLRSNIPHEDFDKMVPDVIELMTEFGLEPEFAFLISRASISKRIEASMLPKPNGIPNGTVESDGSAVSPSSNLDAGDSVMKDSDSLENATIEVSEVNGKTVDSAVGDIKMPDTAGLSKAESPPAVSTLSESYNEVLTPIVDAIKDMGSPARWDILSPSFYVTFWQLSLNDLILPISSYETEISRLAKEQAEVMRDRTDMTRAGMNLKEERKRQLIKIADDLRAELKQQIAAYQRTKARLMKEKLTYFSGCHNKWDALNEAILEQCIFPRVLLSPTDAMYCFQMIKFLHSSGTPHFRTLSMHNKIFNAKRLRLMIFQCSIREAENLGRFLKEVLRELARWHADEALYEKEALGPKNDFPGYAKLLGTDGKPKTVMSYEDFRRYLFKFHKSLNTALKECLGDSEWTQIRNAITILKAVHQIFPAIDFMGKHFFTVLTDIGKREKDKRDDLSLSANALLADLKKREKSWVMPQAFSTGADLSLDQSSIVSSRLKPTAPEFKPQNSVTKASEVEDGEVKDAKNATLSGLSVATPPAADNIPGKSDSKPSVPAAAVEPRRESRITNPPPRSDNLSRNIPPTSSLPRPPIPSIDPKNGVTSLPPRPEPSRYNDLRSSMGRPGDRRDTRDSRMNEGRLNGREHGRDFSDPTRRGADPTPRGSFEDRIPASNRDSRNDNMPPQWQGEPLRDSRDGRDKPNGTRTPDGRLSRDSAMAPPRSSAPHADRLPAINPDRLDLVNVDRQEPLHPERAALISGAPDTSRLESSRPPRDGRRDRDSRPGSRPQSPRRGSDRSSGALPNHTGVDYRREEHANTGRAISSDIHSHGSGPRHDDPRMRRGMVSNDRLRENFQSAPAPVRPIDPDHSSGPRHDDPRMRRGMMSNDRLRESFQSSPAPVRPIDPDHGRLNNSSPRPHQPDPNFGRLNAGSSDVPSGPRGRDSRGGSRAVSTPQPMVDSSNNARDLPRPPTPTEKQVPTGPSNRGARRSQMQIDTRVSQNLGTPSSTPASPGIHPDRLRHLSASGNTGPQISQQQPQSTPSASQAAVHPDRLRQLQVDEAGRAPPSEPSSNSRPGRGSISQAPSPVNAAPRGPRNLPNNSSPTMGPQGFNAPTGPAASGDRAPRDSRGRGPGGPGRQLAGINNIIQGNNGNDRSGPNDRISIRGHSERMGNANQIPIPLSSAPNTPIVVPRLDLMAPKAPAPGFQDSINPSRADLITGIRGGHEEMSSRGGGSRDHDRRSRHGRHSRSRSPKHHGPEDERSTRGSRSDERRGGATELGGRDRERDGGRDRERDSRRSTRDSIDARGSAQSGGSGRVSGRENDLPRDLVSGAVGPRDPRESSSRRDERGARDSRGGVDEAEWNNRRNPDLRDGPDRRSSRGGDGGGSGRKRRGEEGDPVRGNDKRSRR